MSARSRQPAVPCAGTQQALGVRLHPWRDLVGLRLCRLRNRYLCPADHRLAGKQNSTCRLYQSGLVHHSDRGSQYLSIKYTERLAEAGIEPSVGSVGDSYDNALAETINGLYKAEVIHRRGPWRSFEAVEYATLEWVDWFKNRLSLSPSETSRQLRQRLATTPRWTIQQWPPDLRPVASGNPGAVQISWRVTTHARCEWDSAYGSCPAAGFLPLLIK